MPTFPKYRGELPQCLNPRSIRHYFLLAYWVYFRPTALHCYFYQASPEYYQLRGWQKIRQTWKIPACRSLYLMSIFGVLLFVLLTVLALIFFLVWSSYSNNPRGSFSIKITPDERQVAIIVPDKTLKVWDLNTGAMLQNLTKDSAQAQFLEKLEQLNYFKGKQIKFGFSGSIQTSDGQIEVSWPPQEENKKTLIVRNQKTETLLYLRGHTDKIQDVRLTSDGQKAVSASLDKILKVWDLKTGKLLYDLRGHPSGVIGVVLTRDGKKAVSVSRERILKVWDLNNGKAVPLKQPTVNKTRLISFFLVAVLGGLIAVNLLFIFLIVRSFFAILDITTSNSQSPQKTITVVLSGFFIIILVISYSVLITVVYIILGFWIGLIETILTINYEINLFDIFYFTNEAINNSFLDILNHYEYSQFYTSILFFLLILFGYSFPSLFLYTIQLCLSLNRNFHRKIYPVLWNERNILPLPGTQRLLNRCLQQNEATGLELLSEVARNPWRRSAAQKALQSYLHSHLVPLHLLYKLLTAPDMNIYAAIPKSKKDWTDLPTIGQVLVVELGDGDILNPLAWILTFFRRDRRDTPLTRFAEMLYNLLNKKTVEAKNFNLSNYYDIYDRLTNYPGGEEIANSFNAMATFLDYGKLSSLPDAVNIIKQHNYATLLILENGAIRPTVLTALIRLGEVGAEIATYQDATSKVNKQASLLRANDTLEKLEEYVADEVFLPEQAILEQIIEKWRKLVSEAGGEIGRATEAEPVANPYVLGNPVTGFLFVGREDIMRRLEELWMPEQRPSVVIYGHRRMGKTSILQNLGARFGSKTAIVDFNMQRIGLVKSTEDLLYRLSVKLYDSLSADQQAQLEEPARENFAQDPYFALDRFLQQLDSIKLGKRFIITIDEFEKIEGGIKEKRLEPELLDFWRGLIQTYPWFVIAFAGLHTLWEMTEDFWNPLYGSVTAIPISFLTPKAAERLIVQPSPDFDLDYDLDTVEQIINLTNGQPYLVQLIGHTLVTRFNRQTFEEGVERERRFTLEDVEAIINTQEFYLAGNAYFQGVWKQAEKSKPIEQTTILEILSQANLSLTEIANQTTLNLAQVQSALDTLQRHDVITQRDECYVYTVELMRRWVAQRK